MKIYRAAIEIKDIYNNSRKSISALLEDVVCELNFDAHCGSVTVIELTEVMPDDASVPNPPMA